MLSKKYLTRLTTIASVLLIALSSVHPAFAAAPANDNFANAMMITTLPFSDSFNTTEATAEQGESNQCNPTTYHSIWYAFTSATTMWVRAGLSDMNFTNTFTFYKADSNGVLQFQGCSSGSGSGAGVQSKLTAGVTYYFQISSPADDQAGTGLFTLDVVKPSVSFTYTPSDPSVYDSIQFTAVVYDPANQDFTGYQWNFGDGATSTDANPTHQYAKDGDYTVQLTATTSDGRSGTYSAVVPVSTHDVAVSKLTSPSSARVGKSTTITAYVLNKLSNETVLVTLYKSDPAAAGGWALIGSYSQYVPVKSGTKTTTAFSFKYTFSGADTAVGKVSFKAVAEIQGRRDAIPADNTLISSPPTLVSK